MIAALATSGGQPTAQYGSVELKAVQQKYWVIVLGIAVVIHILIVSSYYLGALLKSEEPPTVMVHLVKLSELGPPPSMQNTNTPPPIAVQAPTAKPTVGAPVPVPDAEVSAEQTIATQSEMSNAPSPIVEGSGDAAQVQQDIKIEDDAPPADFVPVEKQPEVVKKVEPKYPELAIKASLEGKVTVKIWVDKEGKVKQEVVLKSDAEIFNEPAIEAAKQWVFTPAYMNNGPVAVWVSVPFKFKLKEGAK